MFSKSENASRPRFGKNGNWAIPAGTTTSLDLSKENVIWQWEHRTGFRNYSAYSCERIEDAYQNGESHVRLKSGKTGAIPMELFFADMIQHDPTTGNTRAIRRIGPDNWRQRMQRHFAEVALAIQTSRPIRESFKQFQQRFRPPATKSKVLTRSHTLHRKDSIFSTVAKSTWFQSFTMLVILVNVIWIGFDAQYNDQPLITASKVEFQVVNNLFCVFFTVEIIIRFLSYEKLGECVRDIWFCVDFFLVILMVSETWILPVVVHMFGDTQTVVVIRGLRFLRLLRLFRISRLLRVFPELMTLIKGIVSAMRSVFFTVLLLHVLMFTFAIIFKTQAEGIDELQKYFDSVQGAMWILLVHGTLLDAPGKVLTDIWDVSPVLGTLLLLFIFLSAYTVLNMLIGILCNVVYDVNQAEKEEVAMCYLKENLVELLECYDEDDDNQMSCTEFELLMRNPEMHTILKRFGVDIWDLMSLKDILFEDKDQKVLQESADPASWVTRTRHISFAEIFEWILRLRGGRSATVNDIMELRECMSRSFERLDRRICKRTRRAGESPEPGDRSARATKGSDGMPPCDSSRDEYPEGCRSHSRHTTDCTMATNSEWEDTVMMRLSQICQAQQALATGHHALRLEVQGLREQLSGAQGSHRGTAGAAASGHDIPGQALHAEVGTPISARSYDSLGLGPHLPDGPPIPHGHPQALVR